MHSNSYGFLVFAYSLIGALRAECPNGWSRYYDSCYRMTHDTETWIDAMNVCRLFGSELVEINNAKENNYVASLVAPGQKSAWIGASDLGIDGEWKWVGSKDILTYTNWSPGQPGGNAINENCLEMNTHAQWVDSICHDYKPYVCERPVAGPSSSLTGK